MVRKGMLLACALTLGPAWAQPVIDGALLGLSEAQLADALPGLERQNKPPAGPHGLKGHWRLSNTPLAQFVVDSTFFAKGRLGAIMRIEQQIQSSTPACTAPDYYAPVTWALEARYGSALVSQDPTTHGVAHQSLVWEAGAFDVLMHITRSATRCSALLIYEPHVGKDASAL